MGYFFSRTWILATCYLLLACTSEEISPGIPGVPPPGLGGSVPGGSQTDVDNDGFIAANDCNDADAAINPDATEITGNDIDEDCSGAANDQDDDGFDSVDNGGEDADDNDDSVYPGAPEICGDGKDNDQDGVIDADCDANADIDNDSFTANQGDCNDGDSTINPNAVDIPGDTIDQDCDGQDTPAIPFTMTEFQNTVLTPSCTFSACHDSASPEEGLDLTPSAFVSIVGVASNQSTLARIEPGSADNSYLMHKLDGTHEQVGGSGLSMPRNQALLGVAVRARIRAWINDGAPNN